MFGVVAAGCAVGTIGAAAYIVDVGTKNIRKCIVDAGTVADELILTTTNSTKEVVKFAVKNAGEEVRLIQGTLREDAQLLLSEGSNQIRLCIDHGMARVESLFKNVGDAAPAIEYKTTAAATEGVLAAFGRRVLPKLKDQLLPLLRQGVIAELEVTK